jgi:hypothetical protein
MTIAAARISSVPKLTLLPGTWAVYERRCWLLITPASLIFTIKFEGHIRRSGEVQRRCAVHCHNREERAHSMGVPIFYIRAREYGGIDLQF